MSRRTPKALKQLIRDRAFQHGEYCGVHEDDVPRRDTDAQLAAVPRLGHPVFVKLPCSSVIREPSALIRPWFTTAMFLGQKEFSTKPQPRTAGENLDSNVDVIFQRDRQIADTVFHHGNGVFRSISTSRFAVI